MSGFECNDWGLLKDGKIQPVFLDFAFKYFSHP